MFSSFMKHDFKNYYAPDDKGGYNKVKRGECFAYDVDALGGKYPQRWYWDIENDFAVRLERNKDGEKIYNKARAERLREQKAYIEQFGCVCKECVKCKGWDTDVGGESQCNSCVKHIIFIPLDEEQENGDGEKTFQIELESDVKDNPENQAVTNELLKTLHKALQTLDSDERVLWRFLVANTKKKVIATHFGWTLDQLSYRQLRLYTKLRSNQALKNFFEK